MRKELKRMGPLSVGILYAVMLAIFGLVAGIIITLMGAAAQNDPAMAGMAEMGAMAIVFMPLIYGVVGFIMGIVSAVIYNLVASMVGGIVMTFEDK